MKRTHGHRYANEGKATRTYQAWSSMLTRCNNTKCVAYKNYGGRGITVRPEWYDFSNFLADMGECPPGYTLERERVNEGYQPDNCSWIPASQQAANTRNTRTITFNGETHHVEEWARITGLGDRLRHRLKKGWSEEKALTTPLRPMKPASQWKKSSASSHKV